MPRPSRSVILLLIAPSAITCSLAFGLMNLRSASHIQLHLLTDRVMFRVTGDGPSQILSPVTIHSVTFKNYSHFEVSPDRVEAADARMFSTSDQARESAWKLIKVIPPVIIAAEQASLQP